MRVTVEFYGVLREIMGRAELSMATESATISAMLTELASLNPELAKHLPRAACVIQDVVVHKSHPLHEGCIVGLIPPVSGG